MKRLLVLGSTVFLGVLLGACTMLVVDDRTPRPLDFAPEPSFAATPVAAADPVLLVWTPDGLPAGITEAVTNLAAVERITEVRGDLVEMIEPAATPGYVVPLDALSVDPASYASFLPKGAAASVAALAPGEAVIGASSARLRGAGPGTALQLASGAGVRIIAVLDDELIGAAELVVAHGAIPEITTPRFLLIAYTGERDAIERDVRDLLPPHSAVRFRAPGETPLLRHGDAVLPQVVLKEQFGEFAYRHGEDTALEIDPAWVREHIIDAQLPLLGDVRCHRAIVADLRAALVELEQRNLGYLIAEDGFRGCYVPRLISTGGGVSRHSWGIALDINWPKNREGELGTQDPRVIDVMTAHGFTWGGPWLVPDPAHFEWVDV